jgi:type I restriction enzyme S subunit
VCELISNWEKTLLVDVVSILGDGLHGTPQYDKDGEYYFINGNNLSNGKIVFKEDTKRVSQLEYEKYKKNLNDRTILVSINGTLGNVALYNGERCILGKSACYFNVKNEVDKLFVKYVVSTREFKEYISRFANGTTIKNVSLKVMRNYKFLLPEVSEQQAIGATLSCIDNKIELNNAINKNLEEMAQALFKRWFVDFEFPNENGEPYKSSGGEFEESDLGLIPKGWRVGTLSDLGEVVGGATPSKSKEEYYTLRGIPWLTPKDLSINKNKYISRGQIDITEEGFKSSSTRLVPKGTILFSSRAPIGYIAISKNEMTTNQGFKSLIPYEHIGSEFLYYVMKFNTETIENRASGSTFKEISGSEMKRVPVIIPPVDIIKQFNITVEPVGIMVEKCEMESDSLIQLRDTLLPKLMSGEIRVPVDIEDLPFSHSFNLPLAAESKAQYTAT